MKRLVVAIAASVLCVASSGKEPGWTSYGAIDCGQWVSNLQGRGINRVWLAGYMSGINAGNNSFGNKFIDPLEGTSMDAVALWMDNWCRTNPLEPITSGGMVLYEELYARAQKRK